MKVGKEEIVGLVVALRAFLARDHEAERRAQLERLAVVQGALEGLPGVQTRLDDREERAYPVLVVHLDAAVLGRTAVSVVNELSEGSPPVAVAQGYLDEGAIAVLASALRDGEERILAGRLREVLIR